ncbi:MAG: phosphoribosyl-ATP diphosphatase [Pseudomonadota bacterium]
MIDQPLGSASELSKALSALAATIDARVGADPESSYTAKLLADGPLRSGKKLAEEAVELALAVAAEGEAEVAAEAADLLYHMFVALRARGLSLDAIAAALEARQGISGLDEKAARTS